MLSQWPQSAQVFMPKGTPLKLGEKLVNRDLAGLFRNMIKAENAASYQGREAGIRAARDFFYKGEPAESMSRFCGEHGGYLTTDDFAEFNVGIEEPQTGTYKEYEIYTCGAWCQGPTLIQTLHLLESVGIADMKHGSAEYTHTVIEAIKLAFADRHAYYGDPDFVDVPLTGLLSKEYAAERALLIDRGRAWDGLPPAGDPWKFEGRRGRASPAAAPTSLGTVWEPDTSYTCVVDRWGNAFSATPSDGQLGEPLVPGLGIAISTRGSQSWLDPDHPSCVVPWKRPRLTTNPALIMKDGELFMPIGTPGLDAQVQAMAQVFLNIVEFGMDPQQAIEMPRAVSYSFPASTWPHPYLPGHLKLEGRFSEQTIADLETLGHQVEVWPDWYEATGGVCTIVVDRARGILLGGADPRSDSSALGR